MDTNPVENQIRPLTLTRKNSLFAGHDEGGRSWARIASLIATCKINSVEPYVWMKATLKAIATGHPQSRIDELVVRPHLVILRRCRLHTPRQRFANTLINRLQSPRQTFANGTRTSLTVLQRLMPALDLSLGLRMVRSAAHVLHALLVEPLGQIIRHVTRTIVAEKPWPVRDGAVVLSLISFAALITT
ncbi:hypothetical protein ACVIW2_006385 [Bradyrhizobium huanghuaihaiense]|uniref:Transposase n=3 Tax=Bradyrhizobium TaxID=374 RepID=A0A8I2C3R8_BRAEL|nr:hypothetical protein [Bradyrhizobium japonicum]MBP1291636.1 hypothetical protein [Bradyrhizobium elkanii]MCS4008628.1 hypothetical protein [Bradyrhizobium elkanii USDA 61]MBP1098077.1 hypothetical protein [Bradyrhizobium japonicum]MBP2429948.1 hypothetical protein [Bradyrhizobium elkanii]